MSAPKGNNFAKGNPGGKSLQDRELAAEVRRLALRHIKTLLMKPDKDRELYRAVLTRLSAQILPRLNEHSGPDGKELPMPILINMNVPSHDSNEEDSGA